MAKGKGPPLTIADRLADTSPDSDDDFRVRPFPLNQDKGEMAIACQVYWIIFTLQWPAISIYALVGKE